MIGALYQTRMTHYVILSYILKNFLQFLYSPVVTLLSVGFTTSTVSINFVAPSNLPSTHSIQTTQIVNPHFSAVSFTISCPSIMYFLLHIYNTLFTTTYFILHVPTLSINRLRQICTLNHHRNSKDERNVQNPILWGFPSHS